MSHSGTYPAGMRFAVYICTKSITEKGKENLMLQEKHRRYIVEQQPIPDRDPDIPNQILASWKRSVSYGISWKHPKNHHQTPDEMKDILARNNDLLKTGHTYILNLYQYLNHAGILLSLADPHGIIIDFIGDHITLSDITERTNMYLGAMRDEKHAGTTAIGLCLINRSPAQILGEEHYCMTFHQHIGTAAPIRDRNNEIIGVLGSVVPLDQKNQNYILAMICSAADSISKELSMKRTLDHVRKVKRQLSTTIEALPNGILLTNSSGRILQHNRVAMELLEQQQNITGGNADDFISPRNSRKKLTELNSNIHNVEYTVNGSPDRKKTLSVSTSFVYDHQHEVTGKIIILEETNKVHHIAGKISGFRATYDFSSIIGNSEPLRKARELARAAADSSSNVLILGESGTGKELFAQAIHNASSRANFPFVAINCASLPKDLIESELFGYVPGAFTGASKSGQPGKFELASGGTIFLDEIGDMPLSLQVSLLRVLQTKTITRLGDSHEKRIDVRVITATNADLLGSVRNHTFRGDLYYRLNVLSIEVPPLRERHEDIPRLVDHFIAEKSRQLGKNVTSITEPAIRALCSYTWPGNIRELENIIERAVNLCSSTAIGSEHLPPQIAGTVPDETEPPADPLYSPAPGCPSGGISYPEYSSRELFLQQLSSILYEEKGNITKTAERMHMSRRTLYRKIDKYNVDLDRFRF